jgi:dolichyl-diphosphooligosaccharide--protein glycosyltransferase
MTVPYSTTGYDEYGPENGYTDVNVRATGPYNVSTGLTQNESGAVVQYGAQFDVSEGQVNGAEDGSVTVELESASLQQSPTDDGGNETQNGTNSTALPTPDTLSLSDDSTTVGETASGDGPTVSAADRTLAAETYTVVA